VRRRQFLEIAAATLAASGRGEALSAAAQQVAIERSDAGQSHRGKVLALITPHLDDGPIFANPWGHYEESPDHYYHSARVVPWALLERLESRLHHNICFHHVVAFEADRVLEYPRNRNLIDARQFKALVVQMHRMSRTSRIHHA
jgi:hypothetical protein